MEAIVVAAVIEKAIVIAGNLAIPGVSAGLYRMQEDIRWLEIEMTRIQSFLKVADAKPGGNEGLINLRREITYLAYDVEDIMDTYLPQIAGDKRRTPILGFLHNQYTALNFAKEIKVIKRRAEDINRARTTYDITDSGERQQEDAWDRRRPFLHVEEPNIIGFDSHIEQLKAKLLNEKMRYDVISIVGMPGLGKTTLAKAAFKLAIAKRHFQCSAMVYVSQEPNLKELLRDIATQVGIKKEKQENNVEANIFEILRVKRYVIFLDDIWSPRVWDALKVSFPINSENGSRVILTSRSRDVGLYIGGISSLYELLPLSPHDSWKLFSTIIMDPRQNNNVESHPPELEDLGRQISTKCGGVPLAIVVTAGLLLSRERTKLEWKWVLENMIQDQEDECSKILALSYQDLPAKMKPLFLYFGLFPEDHEIFAFELINLWVAEKFIESSGDRRPEEVGVEYLHYLVSRYLIQVVRSGFDGRIRSCRIHDLLHSLCISKAMESDFFSIPKNATFSSAIRVRRYTTLHMSNYFSFSHQTPKLRALLCFKENPNLSGKHLQKICEFRFLRVLRMHVNDKWTDYEWSVPKEIGKLVHLTCLQLESYCLKNLPSNISNLQKLVTFDVRGCPQLRIPTCIWKMKQLRHILLDPSSHFYTPSRGFGLKKVPIRVSLPNIQTLCLVPLDDDDTLEANWLLELASLRKLVINSCDGQTSEVLSDPGTKLHKLENLKLWKSNFSAFNEWGAGLELSCYRNLSKLLLQGRIGEMPNPENFPPNLAKLTLLKTQLPEGSLETLEMLPRLRTLKLGSNSYIGKMMVFYGVNSFRQLEVLQIIHLPWLIQLIASDGALPKLKKLIVTNCGAVGVYPERIKSMLIMTK